MQNGGAACESTLQGYKTAAQHAKAFFKGAKRRRSMRKHFSKVQNGGAACESIFHLKLFKKDSSHSLCSSSLKRLLYSSSDK